MHHDYIQTKVLENVNPMREDEYARSADVLGHVVVLDVQSDSANCDNQSCTDLRILWIGQCRHQI